MEDDNWLNNERMLDKERSKLDREDWVKEKAAAEGERKRALMIAKNLLHTFTREEIAKITGLDDADIEALENE